MIGALPASLSPFETAEVAVFRDGTQTFSAGPGDGGLSVSLFAGSFYAIVLNHVLNVPFGTDPPATLTVSGSLAPASVPEPSTAVLAMIGILSLAGWGWRRNSRPAA